MVEDCDILTDEAEEFLDRLNDRKWKYISKINNSVKLKNRYVKAHSYFN